MRCSKLVPRLLIAAALVAALPAAAAVGAGLQPPAPGRTIGDFTLNDALGAKRSLSEWTSSKAIVVVFLGAECPLSKLYGKRLGDLDRELAGQGVQFVGINANQQDTLQELAAYGRKHHIDFPLLKDAGARVADQFGATRTPEAFVLDGQRVIRYHGRIDDQYGVGSARSKATHSELRAAVDSLLAGEPVATPTTKFVGCLIGRREPSPSDGEVTYARDIAPILHKHCVSCHRPGEIAPFALTEYADVAAWADTMLEVIDDGRMPPWHADPAHGEFYNDARLPDEAKARFRQWVKAGVPEGNPADAPPLPEFSDAWGLPAEPTVYRMPQAYHVPATGVVPYQYFVLDPHFTEDKWVYAAQARPGNREVVHHVILFYLPPGQLTWRPQDPLFNAVAAFAPGMPAIVGLESYAARIPAGSKLVFQVHYTPNGAATTDQSEAALCFADPANVEKEVRITAGFNFRFLIPPGTPDYKVTQQFAIQRDSLLYTLTPHMHYRGKSFKFTARYPDGGEEILLNVPRYDFNWQNVYLLKEPKSLPAGTIIDLEAHYDNSADNPLNPDPTQAVHWGDQTWEEMMLGSLTVSLDEQDLRLGPPRVEPLPDASQRRVTFRYRPLVKATKDGDPIETVSLAGEFNHWDVNAQKMDGPDAGGVYSTTIELDPGRYEYKFVINGSEYHADPASRELVGFYSNSFVDVK
jgi:peroxiredoxin